MWKHDIFWKIIYNRPFQQVINKGWKSEINYINIYQNAKALEISVVNSYSGYQLMHTFFRQCIERCKILCSYSKPSRIIEERSKVFDQKSLSIYELKIGYLNLENSLRNTEREQFDQSRCSHCGGSHKTDLFLIKRERKKAIINHPSIHGTEIIIIMNVRSGNQIRTSDVDRMII